MLEGRNRQSYFHMAFKTVVGRLASTLGPSLSEKSDVPPPVMFFYITGDACHHLQLSEANIFDSKINEFFVCLVEMVGGQTSRFGWRG